MMMLQLSTMSRRGRRRLAQWTGFGTLGCILIASAFNYLTFSLYAPDAIGQSLVSATVIPVLLAGPLFFFLSIKLRELSIANHKLHELASTDGLTGCLNRGAFTRSVELSLATAASGGQPGGAMLVIDADNFKAINDRFGHHRGDEALNLIATAIRASLRRGDRIGRLGGEEFGVYLPGADSAEAARVAERVRKMVASLEFAADDHRHPLSVSVGGAVFERPMTFADLFRIADERLYAAKNNGRDRVEMTCIYAGFLLDTAPTVH